MWRPRWEVSHDQLRFLHTGFEPEMYSSNHSYIERRVERWAPPAGTGRVVITADHRLGHLCVRGRRSIQLLLGESEPIIIPNGSEANRLCKICAKMTPDFRYEE